MNRLILIDGNAILHRAYHALPPLTGPDGSVVNAVYGFTSVLLKIWNDFHPTHMAVAFDRPAPTFRKELFKEYQATRPVMESDLSSQIEKVHDVIRAFNIPIYEIDGFEADDVIGTLTKRITSELRTQNSMTSGKKEVIIVTGDRDLLQLVNDKKGIKVFMPVKGLSEGKLFGEKEAKERLGVKATQIPDYKALAGDASDNYPGVAGIGPKTAAELLEKFGSLEALLDAIKKDSKVFKALPQGLQDKLKAGVENATMSRQLATILTGIPIEIKVSAMKVDSLNTDSSRKALEEFQFKSLLRRLTGEEVKKPHKEKPQKEEKKSSQEQLSLV